MTHHEDNTAIGRMLEAVIENGMEGLEAAISILLNEAMKVERSRVLCAEPWQRTEGRLGYANGYKPRSLNSRVGKLSLQVPQVRGPAQRTGFEVGHRGDVCSGCLHKKSGRGDGVSVRTGGYQQ
ncbi:MAG: transposase [Deltaproteobacteria bacterium]|nr:transposase [Deltaproteobacteria bacterium]